MAETRRQDRLPRTGAWLGARIGFNGWWMAGVGLCLATGAHGLVGPLFLVGPAVSCALVAAVLLILELVTRWDGRSTVFGLALGGSLLLSVGVLILLTNHWLAPRVDREPALVEALQRMGGIYRTSDVVPALCLLAAAVLLALALRRVRRSGPERTPAGL